jgi:hypothetical protein
MNSCALRRTIITTVPNLSDRTPAELSLSKIAWDHAQCYEHRDTEAAGIDVDKTIEDCKQKLLGWLSTTEDTQPLRDYFKDFYPTAGDALTGLAKSPCGCRTSFSSGFKNISYQYPRQFRVSDNSSRDEAAAIFDWIKSWAAKRLTYGPGENRLKVDVAVHTRDIRDRDTDKAEFTLLRMDGKSIAGDVTTQGYLKGIVVGEYRYQVTKDKYMTYESKNDQPPRLLDLVNRKQDGKGIVCFLMKQGKPDQHPLPCHLE